MKIPKRIIEKNIDMTDLKILDALTGDDLSEKFERHVTEELSKTLDISSDEIEQRVGRLKERDVIKKFGAIVDPLKVWDHILFTLVKISLAPPLVEESIEEGYPKGWIDVGKMVNDFVTNDELAKKIVRESYTLIGTEWDLMIVTSTNDLNEHREMFEKLVSMGFISMARTFNPIEGAPYVYNPIAVPPPEEVEEALGELKEYLEKN